MNKVCNFDISEVKRMFSDFNEDKRKQAMFKAIVKGGQTLVDETKRQLIKDLPKATEGKRYGKPMAQGVKLKKDKYDNEVLVHILGDYRLKFFELSTKERYIKKKVAKLVGGKYKFRKENNTTNGFRGKIKALRFFEQAYKKENEIINEIDKTLIMELEKLLK